MRRAGNAPALRVLGLQIVASSTKNQVVCSFFVRLVSHNSTKSLCYAHERFETLGFGKHRLQPSPKIEAVHSRHFQVQHENERISSAGFAMKNLRTTHIAPIQWFVQKTKPKESTRNPYAKI